LVSPFSGPLGSITNPLPYPEEGGIFHNTSVDVNTGLIISQRQEDGLFYADLRDGRQGGAFLERFLEIGAESGFAEAYGYVPGVVQSTGDYTYQPVKIGPLDVLNALTGRTVSSSRSQSVPQQQIQAFPQQVPQSIPQSIPQAVQSGPVQSGLSQILSPVAGNTNNKLESYIVLGVMFLTLSSIISLFRR
jgi:hypothetical protein